MSLPAPACHLGYPPDQVEQILRVPELCERFWRYMRGQTMALCNREPEREWVEDPASPGGMRLVDIGQPRCDRPHGGPLTYPWDLERFLLSVPRPTNLKENNMATTKKITEPAIELAPEKDALSEAVRNLIAVLDLREEDVRGIDVRDKIVRVLGSDNSLQTRRIEPLRRIQRDAQGKVVE